MTFIFAFKFLISVSVNTEGKHILFNPNPELLPYFPFHGVNVTNTLVIMIIYIYIYGMVESFYCNICFVINSVVLLNKMMSLYSFIFLIP